jgi:hypothetical protein
MLLLCCFAVPNEYHGHSTRPFLKRRLAMFRLTTMNLAACAADAIAEISRTAYCGAAVLFGRALSSRTIACDCTNRPARRDKN